ncbi:MAG: efflux RND transporter periplasmic adaptor subunit [Myxococcus sp.]|nr:efflux RND transporter periplasmic adaptor subunit [Myxococcus sp.]
MNRLALLLPVVFAAGCHDKPGAAAPPTMTADAQSLTLAADAPQWKYVELAVAAKAPRLAPPPLPGRVGLDPRRTASVGVPLRGRVESVLVRLGARVKQGERLFSVRSGAFADLDRETEAARTQVAVRRRLAERAAELYELKAAAQKEVLAAEAEQKEAELALKAAESKQRSLAVVADGDNLFWVRAPRAGTVVDLELFPGQEVGPEQDKGPLKLSDLDEVLVIADVPESDVRDLSVGQAVMVQPQFGDAARAGAVEYISEVVDPRRRTIEVWVRAQNADRLLRPNAFVQVVVAAGAASPLVLVPDAAVVTRGSQAVVFILASPGRLEARQVQVGRRRDGVTEVRTGLEAGERFVSRGALLLLNQLDLSSDA